MFPTDNKTQIEKKKQLCIAFKIILISKKYIFKTQISIKIRYMKFTKSKVFSFSLSNTRQPTGTLPSKKQSFVRFIEHVTEALKSSLNTPSAKCFGSWPQAMLNNPVWISGKNITNRVNL